MPRKARCGALRHEPVARMILVGAVPLIKEVPGVSPRELMSETLSAGRSCPFAAVECPTAYDLKSGRGTPLRPALQQLQRDLETLPFRCGAAGERHEPISAVAVRARV